MRRPIRHSSRATIWWRRHRRPRSSGRTSNPSRNCWKSSHGPTKTDRSWSGTRRRPAPRSARAANVLRHATRTPRRDAKGASACPGLPRGLALGTWGVQAKPALDAHTRARNAKGWRLRLGTQTERRPAFFGFDQPQSPRRDSASKNSTSEGVERFIVNARFAARRPQSSGDSVGFERPAAFPSATMPPSTNLRRHPPPCIKSICVNWYQAIWPCSHGPGQRGLNATR